MPVPYVRKLAKRHHMTVKKAEEKWNKAKEATKNSGWGATTEVFKKMMHESGSTVLSRVLDRLKITL